MAPLALSDSARVISRKGVPAASSPWTITDTDSASLLLRRARLLVLIVGGEEAIQDNFRAIFLWRAMVQTIYQRGKKVPPAQWVWGAPKFFTEQKFGRGGI